MIKKVSSLLIAAALLLGSMVFATPSFAVQSTPRYGNFKSEMRGLRSPDGRRSIVPVSGQGLNVHTLAGDTIVVKNNIATWRDATNHTIATINLTVHDGQHVDFGYSKVLHRIAPTVSLETALERGGKKHHCIPKWIGVGWNVLWDATVCTPLSLGISGLATPLAGVSADIACSAAGGTLTAALGC